VRAGSELVEVYGADEFNQGRREREEALAAIEDGLLRRSLFFRRVG
jgi:hypothetical protein